MQAIEQSEKLGIDEYRKHYDDFATWSAEALDGNMRTSFEFSFDGNELYGRDGRALGPVFDDALNDSRETALRKPNLVFEYRRRTIEKEEYDEVIKMAQTDAPNTMIVVSDYPSELMDTNQSIGGYNGQRKQTFLRVITRSAEGKIAITSQSLDLSERAGLEQIYSYFGLRPEEGELLGQRIKVELPIEEQGTLVDKLMGVYDRTLSSLYGGQWRGGRKPVDYRNTYTFAKSQQDLIDHFVFAKLENPANAEALRYGIIAAMQKRFELRKTNNLLKLEISSLPLTQEIYMAAQIARLKGTIFAACGLSVGPGGETSVDGDLKNLGYGNKTKEGSSYKFDKKMHCVVHDPEKKLEEVMCGPCGICRECDAKLRSDPSDE